MANESKKPNLAPGEIHLWFAHDEEITDAGLISQYHRVMSPEETRRHQRFRFARHRHQYLVTRALVRSVLSFYHPEITPGEWQFGKNEYGKPHICSRFASTPPLQFNLSHTEQMIVLAVSPDDSIGVDVEYNQRRRETLAIADRVFSSSELEALLELESELQTERFFHLWTMKEAYIKACGMGLAIPLNEFSFHFDGVDSIAISFAPQRRDDPARWHFWGFQPGQHHPTGLAVKTSREHADYQVSMYKITPFAGYQMLQCPLLFASR